MKIHVVGKLHLKGTSKKTGNPYDFIQVHYLGKAPGVEGNAALTLKSVFWTLAPLRRKFRAKRRVAQSRSIEIPKGRATNGGGTQ